jgi:hypothetical protein
MLREGRIPHSQAEGAAIARLHDRHGREASLTRRDPGETGPLLIHIGEDSWEIDAQGKAKKVSKRG